MAGLLKESSVGKLAGGGDGCVAFVYDVLLAGEDAYHPQARAPQLRKDHLDKAVRVALQSRLSEGAELALRSGDAFLMFDGGRAGHAHNLMGAFSSPVAGSRARAILRTVRTLNLVYTESSVAKRQKQARGFMTLGQLERAYLVSHEDLRNLAGRGNKHYDGTTTGDCLAGVERPPEGSEWRVSCKQKKAFLPASARTSSAPEAGEEQEAEVACPRSSEDREPMSFWSRDPKLYEELVHRLNAKAIVDLTSMDSVLPVVACRLSTPYFGFCQSRPHIYLQKAVFKLFLAEGALHKPKLAEAIGAEDADEPEDGEEDGACQANPKGATNPAPKKAPKINAKALRAAAMAAQGRAPKAKSKSKAKKATLPATLVGP